MHHRAAAAALVAALALGGLTACADDKPSHTVTPRPTASPTQSASPTASPTPTTDPTSTSEPSNQPSPSDTSADGGAGDTAGTEGGENSGVTGG